MMRSERWTADPDRTKVSTRGQPWILPSGHISGSVYQTWKCSAHQWFATTVRSVIQRISKRTVVKKRAKYKKRRHLTMIAILYTCTNDDKMLERLLNCKSKDFTRVFFFYLNSVDDKIRFLYDQAEQSALWFELRGNPRVQSTKKTVLPKYRYFLKGSFDTRRERRIAVQSVADPWIIDGMHTHCMSFLAATTSIAVKGLILFEAPHYRERKMAETIRSSP